MGVDDAGALDVARGRPSARPSAFGSGRAPLRYCSTSSAIGPGPAGAAVLARGVGVVPGVEDLEEDPLRPAVVVRVDRRDGAAVVVAEAEAAQLARHDRDVRLGRRARVLPRLDGVLLGRQAEGVVAHRGAGRCGRASACSGRRCRWRCSRAGARRAARRREGTGTCRGRGGAPRGAGRRPRGRPTDPRGWARGRCRAPATGPARRPRCGRPARRCSGVGSRSSRPRRRSRLRP